MADQDQPEPAGLPPDQAPPTQIPSPDSFPTRAPQTDAASGNGGLDGLIPTLLPADSYATQSTDDPSTARHHAPPDAFPGYELLGTLGDGGMGVVYKARQVGLNRLVALKAILGGGRAGPKELIRFLAEAEAVASIKHTNVVQVHEYGEADGRPFLAMEYLPGGNLADRLKAGRLEPRAAAELVARLARGVQAAHDQGIVHRDLKPANVLFDDQGEPRVADFGLAKRARGSDLTRTQAVMGTPAYMSPEQAQGKSKFVGPPADVHALGVILYECLTGTRPFEHDDSHVLLCRIMLDDPEPPSRRVPGLPRDLELIALKCLAKDPADRYPTAGELAEDLRHFAAGEPVSVREPGPIERALKWARRKSTLAAYTLGMLAVLLGGLGGAAVWQWRIAERERGTAVSARDGEKKARADAEQQRDKAVAARGEAEAARVGEANARAEAERQREKFERSEYGRTMEVAHQEWRENNFVVSRALLESTSPGLRGWEWRYVHRLCHSDLLTLKGHTKSVRSASFSADGSRLVTGGEDRTAKVWDGSPLNREFLPQGIAPTSSVSR